jgi:hypothetical protein
MKVFIGPYRNWIGPYQIVDKLFFWTEKNPLDESKEERWDYKLKERLGDWLADTWVNEFCQWAYSKCERKMKIQIDEYDTWSMDHTLSYIIYPMLLQLKKSKHGSPFVDDEDVPENLRSTSAPELTDDQKMWGGTDEFFHDRWSWVLDEMIFAFEMNIKDYESDYYERKDFEGMKVIQDRQSNGFRLFGRYYQGLWD